MLPIFSGFGRSERFTPDLLLEDGYDLSKYGIEARVISIPGHSKGSIGILTASREFFCGDLLVNTDKEFFNSLTDDLTAVKANLQKLGSLRIGAVYTDHGKPFTMHLVMEGNT